MEVQERRLQRAFFDPEKYNIAARTRLQARGRTTMRASAELGSVANVLGNEEGEADGEASHFLPRASISLRTDCLPFHTLTANACHNGRSQCGPYSLVIRDEASAQILSRPSLPVQWCLGALHGTFPVLDRDGERGRVGTNRRTELSAGAALSGSAGAFPRERGARRPLPVRRHRVKMHGVAGVIGRRIVSGEVPDASRSGQNPGAFSSASVELQLGEFKRAFLDFFSLLARAEASSKSARPDPPAGLSEGLPPGLLACSLTQQVVGPLRARVTGRMGVDWQGAGRLGRVVPVGKPEWAVEVDAPLPQVASALRASVTYSHSRGEAFAEVRALEL